eukprot:403369505
MLNNTTDFVRDKRDALVLPDIKRKQYPYKVSQVKTIKKQGNQKQKLLGILLKNKDQQQHQKVITPAGLQKITMKSIHPTLVSGKSRNFLNHSQSEKIQTPNLNGKTNLIKTIKMMKNPTKQDLFQDQQSIANSMLNGLGDQTFNAQAILDEERRLRQRLAQLQILQQNQAILNSHQPSIQNSLMRSPIRNSNSLKKSRNINIYQSQTPQSYYLKNQHQNAQFQYRTEQLNSLIESRESSIVIGQEDGNLIDYNYPFYATQDNNSRNQMSSLEITLVDGRQKNENSMSMNFPQDKPPLPMRIKDNNYFQSKSINTSVQSKNKELLRDLFNKQQSLNNKQNKTPSHVQNLDFLLLNKVQSNKPPYQESKMLQLPINNRKSYLNYRSAENIQSKDNDIVFQIDKSSNKLVALNSMNSQQLIDDISEIRRQQTNLSSEFARFNSKDFNYRNFFNELRGLNTPPNNDTIKQANRLFTIQNGTSQQMQQIPLNKYTDSFQDQQSNLEEKSSFHSLKQSKIFLYNQERINEEVKNIETQPILQIQSQLISFEVKPQNNQIIQQQINNHRLPEIDSCFETQDQEHQLQVQNLNIDDVINQVEIPEDRFDSPNHNSRLIYQESAFDLYQGKQLAPRVSNNRKQTVQIEPTRSQSIKELKNISKDVALSIALKQLNIKEKFVKNKSNNSIITTCLMIYREMVRLNSHNLLFKFLQYKLVKISLKIFRKYRVSKIRLPLYKMNLPIYDPKLMQSYNQQNQLQYKKQATQQVAVKRKLIPKSKNQEIYDTPIRSQTNSNFDFSIHDSEIEETFEQPMQANEAIYWFNQACLHIAIHALQKYQIKIIFSSNNAIINYSLDIFREMMKFNHQNLLIKLVRKRLVQIAVRAYWEYEKQFQQETVIKLYENKLLNLSLNHYFKFKESRQTTPIIDKTENNHDLSDKTRIIQQSHRIEQTINPFIQGMAETPSMNSKFENLSSQNQNQQLIIKQSNVLNLQGQFDDGQKEGLFLNVGQAFLIEYESDEEDKEDSTQSGKDTIIQANSMHERNTSQSSNFSNNSVMQNLMKKVKAYGNLDQASIPQLRELERQLIESQQRLNIDLASNTDNQPSNNSQRVSTNYQTTQASQTQLINMNNGTSSHNERNSHKNQTLEENKTDNIEQNQNDIQKLSNRLKLNLDTVIPGISSPQNKVSSRKQIHIKSEEEKLLDRADQDSNERIKQQILLNYGSGDGMLEEESSQQSSSDEESKGDSQGKSDSNTNRSHSSFDGSINDQESSDKDVNIPLKQLAQQAKKKPDPRQNPNNQRNSMNVPQLQNQLIDAKSKITLKNQQTNQPKSNTTLQQLLQNKQIQQQTSKVTETSLSKISFSNQNIKSTQYSPFIRGLISSGKETPSRVSQKNSSNQLNNLNFSQQHDLSNPHLTSNNSGLNLNGSAFQPKNSPSIAHQISVSAFPNTQKNIQAQNNRTQIGNNQPNFEQNSGFMGQSPKQRTNYNKTEQNNNSRTRKSQMSNQSQPHEEVTNLMRMFKDLDLQSQMRIVLALEPHLSNKSKHNKKGGQKVEIKMKKYSDFLKN